MNMNILQFATWNKFQLECNQFYEFSTTITKTRQHSVKLRSFIYKWKHCIRNENIDKIINHVHINASIKLYITFHWIICGSFQSLGDLKWRPNGWLIPWRIIEIKPGLIAIIVFRTTNLSSNWYFIETLNNLVIHQKYFQLVTILMLHIYYIYLSNAVQLYT